MGYRLQRQRSFIIGADNPSFEIMFKSAYHPKAFLAVKKNVQQGLAKRTKILSLLQQVSLNAKELSQKTESSYKSVLYHLHLLEAEHIVARVEGRPYIWRLTGAGQQTLLGK